MSEKKRVGDTEKRMLLRIINNVTVKSTIHLNSYIWNSGCHVVSTLPPRSPASLKEDILITVGSQMLALAIASRQVNLRQHGHKQIKPLLSPLSTPSNRRHISGLFTPRRRPSLADCNYQARRLVAGSLVHQNGYAAGKGKTQRKIKKEKLSPLVLTPGQLKETVLFKTLGMLLKKTWLKIDPKGDKSVFFEQVMEASGTQRTILARRNPKILQAAERIEKVYGGQLYWQVNNDLELLPRKSTSVSISFNSNGHKVLGRLGIVNGDQAPWSEAQLLVRRTLSTNPAKKAPPAFDARLNKVTNVNDYHLNPISADTPQVPRLSFDLSRVLFNPGVYQLQDPRSRVWNFDPYLGKIMPVSEFNFNALNKYTTSSEDENLREIALQHQSRYIGSTSSMSGMLCHFHYLLSSFRPLTIKNMSRGFGEEYSSFTKLQRGPNAIFLRWQNGTYAVDADKEFDSANILMSLGRSMEKLLTSEKDDFEMYRRTAESDQTSQMRPQQGEAYHYTQVGQFLLRSQLDCSDPRLPGTGVFDLKTRAVAGVRMMLSNPEEGQGYQIKDRYGTWESYEREYYDMMRAALLKYSLQVRMGRMDGIFVAFHNVQRLFGFQYISLPEMDLALHGQTDTVLGDQEFRLSLRILNDIFDKATARYPETSIRFHLEAREATKTSPPHMYVFAEPVTEEEIREIQTTTKSEIEAYEQRLFNPHQVHHVPKAKGQSGVDVAQTSTADVAYTDKDGTSVGQDGDLGDRSVQETHAEDIAFLENMMGVGPKEAPPSKTSSKGSESETAQAKDILAWKLTVQNHVNQAQVERPTNLRSSDLWSVKYQLEPQSPAMGKRNYMLCKNRRKAVLSFPQDEDAAVGYYIQQLVNMSHEGAKWRQQQDERDSQQERVVLYQAKQL